MPNTTCGFKIDPGTSTMVVDVTNASGNRETSYTARHGDTAHTFPKTISSPTEFHFAKEFLATVSVKLNGLEIAGARGSTLSVDLRGGVFQTIAPGVDAVEQLSQSATIDALLPASVGSEVHAFRVTPGEPGRARFQISAAVNSFAGTTDPTLYLGYNFDAQGNLLTPTEPAVAWGMETDYNDGSKRTVEAYLQMAGAAGVDFGYGIPLRPFQFQMDRSTGQLVLSLLACGSPGLQIIEPDQSLNVQITKAQLNVFGRTNQDTFIRAKAGAGRAAQVGLGYNGVDDTFTIGTASSAITVINNAGYQWGQIRASVYGGTQGVLYQGTGGANDAAHIIELSANAAIGFYVKRATSGHTGNLIQTRDENGSPTFGVTAAGQLRWAAAGNEQTTVGAAGGASALPATPTKYLKVVDSAGTTLVIPAYAAS